MEYQGLLDEFVSASVDAFGENLVGVYLHGSLAMGCFNSAKSDIDLLTVTKEPPSDKQKLWFMKDVIMLNEIAPAKGLEMSVVCGNVCSSFVYPTPFELHFSPMHIERYNSSPARYVETMKGEDRDLAAHFTIMRKYGISLYGASVDEVFGEVPSEAYADSILYDITDAAEEPADLYTVLNLCRSAAYACAGLVLSKESGAVWGLANLPPKYRELISEAADCYSSERVMSTDIGAAAEFAEYALELIKHKIGR